MKRFPLVVVAIVLAAGGPAAQDLERLFKSAVNTETVDRNCKAAIEQYKKVAASSNRTLAAQALMRIGGCHEQLGDTEASRIYERIVSDYPEQTEIVAQARARIPQSKPDLEFRKVFNGAFMVAVSPDGRYLVHHNGLAANAVVLRDQSTGVERTLDSGYFFENARFSHDGRRLAYGQCGGALNGAPQAYVCEVRTIDLRAAKPVPTPLYVSEGAFVGPLDWSPDGKLIAVYVQRRAERVLQLGLLRVTDGTLQVLESMSWGGTIDGFFSPDGRDLAYTRRIDDDAGAPDIFLMDVEGKRQSVVIANPSNDFPLGWTPDGRHMLFASDRSGVVSVWAQAVTARKPVGPSILVKALGGDVRPVGMTRSGTLFVGIRTFSQDVEVASFDPASGNAIGTPVQIRSSADRTWLPAWSPDGQFLAYVLVRNGTENTVGVRSTATGNERELQLGSQLDFVRSLAWTPDGRSLVGWGRDLKGRYGVFRIETESGAVAPVVFRDPPQIRQFSWSPDGQKLRYPAQGSLYEHDGQTERLLAPLPQPPGLRSPDGRWIARLATNDAATGSRSLAIQSTIDGESRELYRLDAREPRTDFRWARDGRTLVVMDGSRTAGKPVLVLPIDGTQPVRLEFDASRISRDFPFVELSPDRQHIAYVVGDDQREVWSLENFLPLP